jgi:hypothetical protein
MRVGAAEAPELTNQQAGNVDAMLAFAKATPAEKASVVLDFNHLVTNENMRNILGYDIPISDLPFLKVRKGKSQKPKEDPVPATRKGKEAKKPLRRKLPKSRRENQRLPKKDLSWARSLKGILLRKNQGLRRRNRISNQLVQRLRVFPFAPNPCR